MMIFKIKKDDTSHVLSEIVSSLGFSSPVEIINFILRNKNDIRIEKESLKNGEEKEFGIVEA